MTIREITNESALSFLKKHQAAKEVIFYRNCDFWLGAFLNNVLVATIGYKKHKDGIHLDGSYTKKEFRNQGISTALTTAMLKIIGGKRLISYSRPCKRSINEKFGFTIIQTLKNGTVKMIRYEN